LFTQSRGHGIDLFGPESMLDDTVTFPDNITALIFHVVAIARFNRHQIVVF